MEDFVPYELAVKLKEKGFKEDCLCHYINSDIVYNLESPIANNQLWFCHNKYDNIWHRDNVDAPTISQVLKWLREEKKIHIMINFWPAGYSAHIYIEISEWNDSFDWKDYYNDFDCCKTYELAAIAGVNYCLENLI